MHTADGLYARQRRAIDTTILGAGTTLLKVDRRIDALETPSARDRAS